ncbi:MAG: Spo0E like sporulation regulatory protein [Pelotomaculum sp. PtaB.Bin104]|nr:MAG: Spo0E like sporulation regulatory protein [Pelotomaculum sp. PtaB.Bin104]
MGRKELLEKIECLRAKMHSLAVAGDDYAEVLEVSRRLDELIVAFHKTEGTGTVAVPARDVSESGV